MASSSTKINLADYQAGKGLPQSHVEKVREQIELPILTGVDRDHNIQMITHTDATSDYLYNEYTSTTVSYKRGSRPFLERIADAITARYKGHSVQIQALATWVIKHIEHPISIPGDRPADCNLTEEQIIERGWGWCNEQARILISLAQIAGYPGRMCFLFHKDGPASHATTEIFFHNKWVFVDPTYGGYFGVDPTAPYSARDINQSREARRIVDDQYARLWVTREIQYDHHFIAPAPEKPRLDTAIHHRSDYFTNFALCNHII